MLQSIKVIASTNRNSSVDIFRGLAIISVVLFHFYPYLPYGQLGVDLFFVISGLLVGGLLTKDFANGLKINFFKFFLQRGFKIWPSYYNYLIVGNLVAYFCYTQIAPDQYIRLWEIKRYLFFYQNYTGAPFHASFDGVWSLCVEEHFYIMLPIGFIVLQAFKANRKMLFISIGAVIFLGIVFKILGLYFTHSKDTSAGTQYRIDALGWGVLLNLLTIYCPRLFEKTRRNLLVFLVGVAVLCVTIFIDKTSTSIFYTKVLLHTLAPISFFLMLFGVYNIEFKRLKVIKFMAYYSYNWYLWHPLFRPAIRYYIGENWLGFLVYLTVGFGLAMLFTIIVEEPCLKKRRSIIKKIFGKESKAVRTEPFEIASSA